MSQRKPDYVDDADIDESLDDLPAADAIEEAVENLEANGFEVVVVDSADAALAELQSLIPAGASVMNGHSTTLEEIGFTEYLSEGRPRVGEPSRRDLEHRRRCGATGRSPRIADGRLLPRRHQRYRTVR